MEMNIWSVDIWGHCVWLRINGVFGKSSKSTKFWGRAGKLKFGMGFFDVA